jgi:hypothetical protein
VFFGAAWPVGVAALRNRARLLNIACKKPTRLLISMLHLLPEGLLLSQGLLLRPELHCRLGEEFFVRPLNLHHLARKKAKAKFRRDFNVSGKEKARVSPLPCGEGHSRWPLTFAYAPRGHLPSCPRPRPRNARDNGWAQARARIAHGRRSCRLMANAPTGSAYVSQGALNHYDHAAHIAAAPELLFKAFPACPIQLVHCNSDI